MCQKLTPRLPVTRSNRSSATGSIDNSSGTSSSLSVRRLRRILITRKANNLGKPRFLLQRSLWEAHMRSNLAILGIAVLALLIAVESSSAEVIYPWCAQYSTKGGARNCGFTTWEQCRATVSGIGGYCIENPFYQPAADPAVRRKPRRASGSATVAPAEAARPDERTEWTAVSAAARTHLPTEWCYL